MKKTPIESNLSYRRISTINLYFSKSLYKEGRSFVNVENEEKTTCDGKDKKIHYFKLENPIRMKSTNDYNETTKGKVYENKNGKQI